MQVKLKECILIPMESLLNIIIKFKSGSKGPQILKKMKICSKKNFPCAMWITSQKRDPAFGVPQRGSEFLVCMFERIL